MPEPLAALLALDPVEALGQARQMFARDAGAGVGDAQGDVAFAARPVGRQQRQPRRRRRAVSAAMAVVGGDAGRPASISTVPPPSGEYFTALSIRFCTTCSDLVAVADDHGRAARRQVEVRASPRVRRPAGAGRRPRPAPPAPGRTRACRRRCARSARCALSDIRSSISRAMRSAWAGHDAQEPLARHRRRPWRGRAGSR